MRAGGGTDWVFFVAALLAALGTLVLGIVTWAWLLAVALLWIAAVFSVLRLRAAHLGTS